MTTSSGCPLLSIRKTNEFLHVRLFTTTTTALTQQFLRELREKHDVSDAMFFVDTPTISRLGWTEPGFNFNPFGKKIETASNVSFER